MGCCASLAKAATAEEIMHLGKFNTRLEFNQLFSFGTTQINRSIYKRKTNT